jgi:ABC-type branched-subunit amino acid transport system substrate-binding protein
VPFLPALSGPREVTLGGAPPNLYRVVPDVAQSVAGLASYAHDDLGWRRAAVVSDDWEAGWASADAFAAEFCRLGGHVVGRATVDVTGAAEIARLPASVDGIAVLMSPLFGPVEPVRRLAARFGEPARSIVLGPYLTVDHDLRRALGPLLDGAVGATLVPPADSPQLAAYQRAFAQTFPGLPPAVALSENAVGFRDAVEAVVRAFERAGGRERLQAELAATRGGLLSGQRRLDGNRQAVVAGTLARLRRDGTLVPLRRLPPVDQTLGGALPADHEPARSTETC